MDQQEWMNEIHGRILSEFMDEYGRLPTDEEMETSFRNHHDHLIAVLEIY